MKRIFAFLLAMVMVLGMYPATTLHVHAEEAEEFTQTEETDPEETEETTETVPEDTTVTEKTSAPTTEETEPATTVPQTEETEPTTTVPETEETEPATTVPETEETEPATTVPETKVADPVANAGTEAVTYDLTDGILTISGIGPMDDYASASDAPWYSQRTAINKVVIEEGITRIGNRAFYNCTALMEVVVEDTVTAIGEWAFQGDTALAQLQLPASVVAIEASALRSCSALSSLTFAGNAPTLGNYALTGCASDLSLSYYEGTTGWDAETWKGYSKTVMHVGQWITDSEPTCTTDGSRHINCAYCNTTITERIPGGHKYVDGICSVCKEAEVLVSGSCGTDVYYTLYSTGLLKITGSGDMEDVAFVPWYSYRSEIKSVTIADGVTSIGYYAFRDCSNLTSITIPRSIISIDYSAFSCCSSLTSIAIPDSVNSIGDYAFAGCSRLTRVTIPEGVTGIGEEVFSGCSSLTSITIPEGVTSIGSSSFSKCSSLTSITIPDSVTSIGEWAFAYCSSLTSITIPEGVTSIGNRVFYNCSKLMSIEIPKGVTSIGEWVFAYCSSLISVTISEGVTSIGEGAFHWCSSLTSVTIGEGMTSIGEDAFSRCSSLTRITIPASVTNIGPAAFSNCSSLERVIIPEGVTSINKDTFVNCSSLTSITIPKGVTSIGESAFFGCNSLTSITIPNSVNSIGDSAFYVCYGLTDVYYLGTEAQWNAITIGEGNEYLTNATIHFTNAVKITKQPVSVCVDKGETAKVTIKATGESLTYQWYFKDPGNAEFSLSSAHTGSSYTAKMSSAVSGRQVYCVVADKYGNSAETDTVTLYQKATITSQPKNVCVAAGKIAAAAVTAVGKGLTYQWYYKDLGNATFSRATCTSSRYALTMGSQYAGRQVYCVVTDQFGNRVTSNTVTLHHKATITAQPKNVCVAAGKTAATAVTAVGTDLTYQWYYKDAGKTAFSKTSCTASRYALTMGTQYAGRQVYCVVTDRFGNTVTSKTVTLYHAVAITAQPKNVCVAAGRTAAAAVTAVGEGLSYQWYYKDPGKTAFSKTSCTASRYAMTMSNQYAGRQVYCVVTDRFGKTATSNTVTLNQFATITSQPKNVYVAGGKTAAAAVQAVGAGLTYRWYYKDPGKTTFSKTSCTTSRYALTMGPRYAGRQLFCIVTDQYGNTAKSSTVTLHHAVAIETQPTSVSVAAGSTAKVAVKAVGSGLTYQWYCKAPGGTKFARASCTTSTYSLKMSSSVAGRQAYCVITDQFGYSVKSNVVTLKMK